MRRALLVLALGIGSAWALGPGALAPGVPELDEAEGKLKHFVLMSEATGDAVSRMQVAWTALPPVTAPCEDAVRLQLGWRIEHFGAAWREAAQAAVAQAGRTRKMLDAPAVAPLIDSPWKKRVTALADRADTQASAFRDASAWENNFVRATLAACPMPEPTAHPGLESGAVEARQDASRPVAVLAMGDGWVCPGRVRADDAVVLVEGGNACWAATDDCACAPERVRPGAVVTAPVVAVAEEEVVPIVAPATPISPPAAPTPKPKPKKKPAGPEKGPPAP